MGPTMPLPPGHPEGGNVLENMAISWNITHAPAQREETDQLAGNEP